MSDNPLICEFCGGQVVVDTVPIPNPPGFRYKTPNSGPAVRFEGFVCEECGRKPSK